MKKIVLVLGLFFMLSSFMFAQQDSLFDFFPLEIGKQFYYDFNLYFIYPYTQTSDRDTGVVNYRIVNNSFYSDSTIWEVNAIRNYYNYHRSGGLLDITYRQDSTDFIIIEKHQGMHELYTPVFRGTTAFPFFKDVPDSQRFFRYKNISENQQLSLLFLINSAGSGTTYSVNYLIAKDTGIVRSNAYEAYGWFGNYTAAFYLKQVFTNIEEDERYLFNDYQLFQNYPNPFNPSTKISWQSPVGSWQTLKVYDVLGNEVATLIDEYRSAGSYEIEFSTAGGPESGIKHPASGIYFYRLQTGDYVETKKIILLK